MSGMGRRGMRRSCLIKVSSLLCCRKLGLIVNKASEGDSARRSDGQGADNPTTLKLRRTGLFAAFDKSHSFYSVC